MSFPFSQVRLRLSLPQQCMESIAPQQRKREWCSHPCPGHAAAVPPLRGVSRVTCPSVNPVGAGMLHMQHHLQPLQPVRRSRGLACVLLHQQQQRTRQLQQARRLLDGHRREAPCGGTWTALWQQYLLMELSFSLINLAILSNRVTTARSEPENRKCKRAHSRCIRSRIG